MNTFRIDRLDQPPCLVYEWVITVHILGMQEAACNISFITIVFNNTLFVFLWWRRILDFMPLEGNRSQTYRQESLPTSNTAVDWHVTILNEPAFPNFRFLC